MTRDTAVAGGTEIPPRGDEETRSSPKKTSIHEQRDVKSDVGVEKRFDSSAPHDPDAVADLAARLASLPPEALAALHALFSGPTRKP
jgi:hypothetical protein